MDTQTRGSALGELYVGCGPFRCKGVGVADVKQTVYWYTRARAAKECGPLYVGGLGGLSTIDSVSVEDL